MIRINPREYFALVRQISDPTDTDTYYVQVKIRNAKTDVLLDTVNLTDKGDQRFSKSWQAGSDVSGNGTYIIATSRVYTDSGYSTESALYSVEQIQYLIQERYNPIYGNGSGGGYTADVDYKKIETMINKAVSNIPETKIPKIKFPKQKEADIKSVLRAIDSINIPEQEKLDLSPALSAIKEIKFPEPEKFNYERLEEAMQNLSKTISDLSKGSNSAISNEFAITKQELTDALGELRTDLKRPINFQFPNPLAEGEEKPKRKFVRWKTL